MFRISLVAASIGFAWVASAATPASAHREQVYAKHQHYRAAKLRYGGHPHLGYWRPGPARGPRFGFSTYRGDPFGADDYYDGDRCYYVKGSNYCNANHIFNGFD